MFCLNLSFFPLGKIHVSQFRKLHLLKAFSPLLTIVTTFLGTCRGLRHWLGGLLRENIPVLSHSHHQSKMYTLKQAHFHLLYHYCSMQVINCIISCVLTTNHHHASLIFSYSFATLRPQETYNYRGILRLCIVHLPTLPSFHSVVARNSTEDAEMFPLTFRYSKSIQISYFLPLPSGILMREKPQSSFSGLSTSI